jgi:hypothetical protein
MTQLALGLPWTDGVPEVQCICTLPPRFTVEVGSTRYLGAAVAALDGRSAWTADTLEALLASVEVVRIFTRHTFDPAVPNEFVDVPASGVRVLAVGTGR